VSDGGTKLILVPLFVRVAILRNNGGEYDSRPLASPPSDLRSTLLRFWPPVFLFLPLSNQRYRRFVNEYLTVESLTPFDRRHIPILMHRVRTITGMKLLV